MSTNKLFSSYIFHCQTSVHAGDGTSTGTIDMPIQRERTTGFPVLRDSTTRGAIREHFETPLLNTIENKEVKDNKFIATFGNRHDGDKSSSLDVLPARLLFFPVRSIRGVFAYVTCPFVLNRFAKEMKLFHNQDLNITLPNLKSGECYATTNLLITNNDEKAIGLEEFTFIPTEESCDINAILKVINKEDIDRLDGHFAIIDDTSFSYFTRLFTEKVTRNRIDIKTGVASDTGLFNEEFLPEESILYTTFGYNNEFSTESEREEDNDIQKYFDTNFTSLFQLGGDKSVGKGLIIPYKIDFTSETTTTKEEEL